MALREKDVPKYDEKVKKILRGLAEGKTREELADELGNSHWKSVDMYMRRRHFTWDSSQQTYVPKIESKQQEVMPDSSKAGHVISLLNKDGADLRTVAERLGFKDHRELAQYMNVKGYVWDSEKANYVKQIGKVAPLNTDGSQSSEIRKGKQQESFTVHKGWEDYLPLLEMLDKHREKLLDLIVPIAEKGTIPRFVVPGVAKTKTIQMMNTLEQLVVDFSREKNISQRELFEVALIEFFRKYGYEQEVERLLMS